MSARKLLAAALGAVAGAALLASPMAADPAAASPAAADCRTYEVTAETNRLRPGYEAVPWSYIWSEGATTFSFCVDVPDAAEVVVDVRQFSVPNQQWETVLTAPGRGDQAFSYPALAPGIYRLYVTGISGTGNFVAGLSFDRGQ